MIARRIRQSGLVVATVLGFLLCSSPALAAAESTATESIRPLASSPFAPEVHWSRDDLEDAEPLPIVELPGSPRGAARTAAIAGGAAALAAAPDSVEVGETESTVFPNRANGKLFGEFRIPQGETQVRVIKYQCSASVVPSRWGSVILTAAHCLIDPATGTQATPGSLIFIPAYRNGVAPDGAWQVTDWGRFVTERWFKWAEKRVVPPNEGEDLAFLVLEENREPENLHYGEDVEDVVGSLGINFDQACVQTYTQFGYPAESPYNGEVLFSHIAPFAGTDLNPAVSPRPIKIASDFTRGSSGGPWTIGSSSAPTVLSITAYGYENQPGYLYGPYFGEAARKVYERASGQAAQAGTEDSCVALPENPPPTQPVPTPTPAPTPPVATPAPVTLRLARLHRRANGSAVLTATVSTGGVLRLTGTAVRNESVHTPAAGQYRLMVAPKGPATRRLRRVGKARVEVKIAFKASGQTKVVARKISLSRPDVARAAAQKHAPQPR